MYRLTSSLLSLAVVGLWFPPAAQTGSCPARPACKAVHGTADWPSQGAWASLNATLGRRLLRPAPPGAVCHPGEPSFNTSRCAAVSAAWSVYDFHAADPVSVMWDHWSNDTCLPDGNHPCSNAGYPAYVVNATEAKHVKAAVDFARKNNVRLVVKATGHDFLGRSIAPNSLSIWTHHMRGLQIHAGSFRPKGCKASIPGNAVTAAAGSQMRDLYEQLDIINQTVVGGGAWSVGVGGYLTGGGHSILSPRYGLAVDQVLELEMVTPQGDIITANECQHEDLFWAMRGGGGSTFGVLTSVTLKTYPTPKMLHTDFGLISKIGDPRVWDYAAYFLSQFPTLETHGVAGYTFALSAFPNPFPEVGDAFVSGVFGRLAIPEAEDENQLMAALGPVIQHINTTWPDAMLFVQQTTLYPSFLAWYQVNFDSGTAGGSSYLASRLLDDHALTSNVTALRDAVETVAVGAGAYSMYLVSGKGVHTAKPRGGSNSVHPAWRKAYAHTIGGISFPPFNATAEAEARVKANEIIQPIRDLSPGMGAYMNEAFPFEPDWQHAFWGDNYERLAKIKRKVDPHDVLWCTPCVGNERWHEVGDKLCKV